MHYRKRYFRLIDYEKNRNNRYQYYSQNRILKQNLIYKAQNITSMYFNCWNNYKDANTKMYELMQEWREAGYAGDADSYLWNQFSQVRKYYFGLQNQFILDVHNNREILIEDVARIRKILIGSSNIDRKKIKDTLLEIQHKWKNIPWIGNALRGQHSCLDMKRIFKDNLDAIYAFLKKTNNEYNKKKNYSKNENSGYQNNERTIEPMTLERAMKIFELRGGYTKKDVKTIYRKLISKHHPDKGGETETAQYINTARDMLNASC